MVNRLGFVPGESPVHGLHFWEPVVDGRPLRHILTDVPGDESADWVVGDNVPVLVHSWPIGLPNDVLVLLGERPPELANGRVPLFVCPVCGDLGCGAITAAIEWTADTVVWRDFGRDVNYDTDEGHDLFAGPLVFERAQYESELRRFIDTFADVRGSLPPRLKAPVDGEELHRRPRRRWWPFTQVGLSEHPHMPRSGRGRSPASAALRAATLARICRVEGGYARPDLPR